MERGKAYQLGAKREKRAKRAKRKENEADDQYLFSLF
jgi:hypothetical protein